MLLYLLLKTFLQRFCYSIIINIDARFNNVVQKGIHSSENLLNFKPKKLETEPMRTLKDLTND